MVLDLSAADLGLGVRLVSAVAVFPKDDRIAGLHFAQARGVPHIRISGGITEIGPEVAAYIHKPVAAPIVLGAEWLVGATTIPTLEFAKAFSRVHDITIGALLDEQDTGGPATTADLERLTKTMSAALTLRDGAYTWREGDDAKATFRAADGTEMEATAFAAYDIVGLRRARPTHPTFSSISQSASPLPAVAVNRCQPKLSSTSRVRIMQADRSAPAMRLFILKDKCR